MVIEDLVINRVESYEAAVRNTAYMKKQKVMTFGKKPIMVLRKKITWKKLKST